MLAFFAWRALGCTVVEMPVLTLMKLAAYRICVMSACACASMCVCELLALHCHIRAGGRTSCAVGRRAAVGPGACVCGCAVGRGGMHGGG